MDLARHWVDAPWARYSLVFLALTGVALGRADAVAPRPRSLAGLAVCIVVALLLVAGGRTAWARVMLPLAFVALCRARGWSDLRTAALAVFCVSVPALLNKWTAPELPELASAFAVACAGALAKSLEVQDAVVQIAGQPLEIRAFDGGVALAFLCAGLAWAACLSPRASVAATALWMGLGSLAGFLLQCLVWCAALATGLALGAPSARSVLDHAPLALAVLTAAALIGLWQRNALGPGDQLMRGIEPSTGTDASRSV